MAETSPAPTSDLPAEGADDPYRLPSSARPSRYDVRLRPALDAATFDGSVAISLDIDTSTSELVLNSADLEIGRCTIDGADASWRLEPRTERLIVTAAEPLTVGTHELTIDFTGTLNDKLHGFYRSTYTDSAGVDHIIATTQMEPTDCRRAFPCWDEPEFKAVFGITLDVADGLTAISNGAEADRSTADGRTVIRFADTMVMSSYLVAMVVGELEATEPIDVDGIPLRIVHVPGKEGLTEFGLDVGAFCLRWYQDYYGIPYPSDKVDLVALPDFAAGAMENLGCITFRETYLLIDPATSTQFEQQTVADVVAHEVAHMWFGDLVTMRWWNGIWLNEAFATFMEIAACDAYRPDWERWTSFGAERSGAFDTDSLHSTRPVEFEVRSPDDCEGMFDVLTYQKGAALLRMLEQYLGEDRFREGVSHYLRIHSYANTETNDLWDAIEATSGEPVRRIMDSWIWQPGYPLVGATLVEHDGVPALRLGQRRFSFDAASSTSNDATDELWAIPVHVRNGGETTRVLLDGAMSDPIALADPDGVVIVNAGGHGFFRVDYCDTLRSRLDADALPALSALERYAIVDDAWAATVAGRLSATDLLAFLEGFVDERDYTVWQSIVAALRGLGRLLGDGPALSAFQERVRALLGPALGDLGKPTDGDSDLDRKLRGLLLATAGVLGADADIRTRCFRHFDRPAAELATVDPELVAAATSVLAAAGDRDTYARMRQRFSDATTPQEQLRYLYALAEFDDEQLLVETCEFAMGGSVRTQNAPFLLRAAIANPRHGAAAWGYLRDHWDIAVDRFPSNTIGRMIASVRLLDTPDLVDDTAQFFAEHPVDQAAKTLEQILERQRINAALRTREHDRFGAALMTPA